MNSSHSFATYYDEAHEIDALEAWASKSHRQFPGEEISLGLVFITPRFFNHAVEILEILRVHARIPLLIAVRAEASLPTPKKWKKTRV